MSDSAPPDATNPYEALPQHVKNFINKNLPDGLDLNTIQVHNVPGVSENVVQVFTIDAIDHNHSYIGIAINGGKSSEYAMSMVGAELKAARELKARGRNVVAVSDFSNTQIDRIAMFGIVPKVLGNEDIDKHFIVGLKGFGVNLFQMTLRTLNAANLAAKYGLLKDEESKNVITAYRFDAEA